MRNCGANLRMAMDIELATALETAHKELVDLELPDSTADLAELANPMCKEGCSGPCH